MSDMETRETKSSVEHQPADSVHENWFTNKFYEVTMRSESDIKANTMGLDLKEKIKNIANSIAATRPEYVITTEFFTHPENAVNNFLTAVIGTVYAWQIYSHAREQSKWNERTLIKTISPTQAKNLEKTFKKARNIR